MRIIGGKLRGLHLADVGAGDPDAHLRPTTDRVRETMFNLLINSPGNYSLDNSVTPVCTSVDSGNGIGIGAGQVSSALCTLNTLLPGANRDRYAFADPVYFTPVVNRLFGVYAYDQVRQRW